MAGRGPWQPAGGILVLADERGGSGGVKFGLQSLVPLLEIQNLGVYIRSMLPGAAAAMYLLLQADYAGPLLLQEALVLFAGGIVEASGDIDLLTEGSGRLGRVDDSEIGYYGLVAGGNPSVVLRDGCRTHSQLFGLPVG